MTSREPTTTEEQPEAGSFHQKMIRCTLLALVVSFFVFQSLSSIYRADSHQSQVSAQESLTQWHRSSNSTFPKIVWTYEQKTEKKQLFLHRCYQNIRTNARRQNYSHRHLVEGYNESLHLSQKSAANLARFTQTITSDLLRRNLIKLYTLMEWGGIWVDDYVTVFDSLGLDWLQHLPSNIYSINNFNRDIEYFSFSYVTVNQSIEFNAYDREMQAMPNLTDRFVAAVPSAKIIVLLAERVEKIYNNVETVVSNAGSLGLINSVFGDLMGELISDQQRELFERQTPRGSEEDDSERPVKYAVAEYGIVLMREDLLLDRFENLFGGIEMNAFYYLHRSQYDMEQYHGLFKYAQEWLHPYALRYFEESLLHDRAYHKHSLWARQVMLNAGPGPEWIYETFEEPLKEVKNEVFFEKIVWVYYSSGFDFKDIVHRACYDALKRAAEMAGYDFRAVDDVNVYQWLTKEQVQLVVDTVNHETLIPFFPTISSDLYRLLLLIQHGGVYLDMTTYPMEDFSWLERLRFDPLVVGRNDMRDPEVLFVYQSYQGTRELVYNEWTKRMVYVSPGFETFFIAAKKGARFLRLAFEDNIKVLGWTESRLGERFLSRGIVSSGEIKTMFYWEQIGCVQYLIQTKQRQLDLERQAGQPRKFAIDEYGILGLDVHAGAYKIHFGLAAITNYLNAGMTFERSREYVVGLFGEPKYFIKLNGYHAMLHEAFLNEFEVRPGSFGDVDFLKYISKLDANVWKGNRTTEQQINNTAQDGQLHV